MITISAVVARVIQTANIYYDVAETASDTKQTVTQVTGSLGIPFLRRRGQGANSSYVTLETSSAAYWCGKKEMPAGGGGVSVYHRQASRRRAVTRDTLA